MCIRRWQGQALKQKDCFSCVIGDDGDAFPISCTNSMVPSFHERAVSIRFIEMGKGMCMLFRAIYLLHLFRAGWSAVTPAIESYNGLDLQNGSMSNVNMSTASQCRTFHSMAIVLFALYVTDYEKYAVEICMTLNYRMGQDSVYINKAKAKQQFPMLYLSPFAR